MFLDAKSGRKFGFFFFFVLFFFFGVQRSRSRCHKRHLKVSPNWIGSRVVRTEASVVCLVGLLCRETSERKEERKESE